MTQAVIHVSFIEDFLKLAEFLKSSDYRNSRWKIGAVLSNASHVMSTTWKVIIRKRNLIVIIITPKIGLPLATGVVAVFSIY